MQGVQARRRTGVWKAEEPLALGSTLAVKVLKQWLFDWVGAAQIAVCCSQTSLFIRNSGLSCRLGSWKLEARSWGCLGGIGRKVIKASLLFLSDHSL